MGNSLYTVIMPRSNFSRQRYVQMVCNAISPYRPGLFVSPRHDIFLGDCKVSGSAFRVTRERAYHHGTMLLDTKLDMLQETLSGMIKEEQGAAVTSVVSRVCNIGDGIPQIDHDIFCALVSEKFREEFPDAGVVEVSESDIISIEEVCNEASMLQSEEWIYDKSPPFTLSLPLADITVEDGTIIKSMNLDLLGRKLRPALFSQLVSLSPYKMASR